VDVGRALVNENVGELVRHHFIERIELARGALYIDDDAVLLQHGEGNAPLRQPPAMLAVVRVHIVDHIDLDGFETREPELGRDARPLRLADGSDFRRHAMVARVGIDGDGERRRESGAGGYGDEQHKRGEQDGARSQGLAPSIPLGLASLGAHESPVRRHPLACAGSGQSMTAVRTR